MRHRSRLTRMLHEGGCTLTLICRQFRDLRGFRQAFGQLKFVLLGFGSKLASHL